MRKNISISYSWDDKAVVNRIDNALERLGVSLTRDIRDLEYNANIHDFMNSLTASDRLIIFVSASYLKSVNCMYEASQVLKMKKDIVIIVKKNLDIFDVEGKQRFIDYWNNKYNKALQLEIHNFANEIMDIKIAKDNIAKFIDFVKNNYRMNEDNLDFNVLFEYLQKERIFHTVITKDVINWIASTENTTLNSVIKLVIDLKKSTSITFSEYPNIPDNECQYLFNSLKFEKDVNGIILKYNDRMTGKSMTKCFSEISDLERNNLERDIHSKYYFHCVNLDKKRKCLFLENNFSRLDKDEKRLLSEGFIDVYRIIINF